MHAPQAALCQRMQAGWRFNDSLIPDRDPANIKRLSSKTNVWPPTSWSQHLRWWYFPARRRADGRRQRRWFKFEPPASAPTTFWWYVCPYCIKQSEIPLSSGKILNLIKSPVGKDVHVSDFHFHTINSTWTEMWVRAGWQSEELCQILVKPCFLKFVSF